MDIFHLLFFATIKEFRQTCVENVQILGTLRLTTFYCQDVKHGDFSESISCSVSSTFSPFSLRYSWNYQLSKELYHVTLEAFRGPNVSLLKNLKLRKDVVFERIHRRSEMTASQELQSFINYRTIAVIVKDRISRAQRNNCIIVITSCNWISM